MVEVTRLPYRAIGTGTLRRPSQEWLWTRGDKNSLKGGGKKDDKRMI
jgi:hypothetical protein